MRNVNTSICSPAQRHRTGNSARPTHHSSYASIPGCCALIASCTFSSSPSTCPTASSNWSYAACSARRASFFRGCDRSNLSMALTNWTPSDRIAMTCIVQLKCSWSASMDLAIFRCSSARRRLGTASAIHMEPFSRRSSATASNPPSAVRAFRTPSLFAATRAFRSCLLAIHAAPPMAAIAPRACTQLAHSALVMQVTQVSHQNRQYSCGGFAAAAASPSAFINSTVFMPPPFMEDRSRPAPRGQA